jgi:hypothetical protein
MKYYCLLIVACVFAMAAGCKKDTSKNYNVLKITEGEFNGYTYTFQPNLGFWSDVDQTTKYIHLVFGAENNQPPMAPGIMDILLYYSGVSNIIFPTPEGQWIQLGLTINSADYYFRESYGNLTINYMSDYEIQGHISANLYDLNQSSRTIAIEMDFSLSLQMI